MPGGRPPKFNSVEDMQEKIDKYFNETPMERWTITGLALALDTDRMTLLNYQNKDEYFYTIKRAKTLVEHSYEMRLIEKGNAGMIFALKNFNWTDKQEVEATVNTSKLDSLIEQLNDTDEEA